MKIKGSTIYYTNEDARLLLDNITERKDRRSINEIHIPNEIQEKTRGVSILFIRKIDDQIYFILDGFIHFEVGVFYSRDRNPKLYAREIRRLFNFKGEGYWYYFSAK